MPFDLDNFWSACRAYTGGEPAPTLRQLSGEFIHAAPKDLSLLAVAARQLTALPPNGTAWLALALGTCVEHHEDLAVHTAPALLAVFRQWLSQLPRWEDTDEEDEADDAPLLTSEQSALVEALPFLCQSLVAHLARVPAMREQLAEDGAWMEHLESVAPHSHAIGWVEELLKRRSGPLLLLHPTSGRGAMVRYENVSNCFHLFSLIQSTVGQRLPGGQVPDEKVAAAARAEGPAHVHDHAWWHYGDPRSTTADLGASIWGEAHVSSIPVIRGVQVILLWPCLLGSRSWDGGFFTPEIQAAPPSLTWEAPLSDEAYQDWAQALGLPAATAAP